uniref:Vitronectin n=1 Tax=Leptobrachium leishanense TaxID=445787 RepID=A0A8C5MYJ5_9ANUR
MQDMGTLQLLALLLLGAISSVLAAEESCEGRCFEGFNQSKKCQCDDICKYYDSCCADYFSVCSTKETRGDVFSVPEDGFSEEYADPSYYEATSTPSVSWTSISEEYIDPLYETTSTPTVLWTTTTTIDSETTMPVTDTTAMITDTTPSTPDELCSGKPFDAFTNLKNGSIYAFRGKYFYELDETKALEGYPKLIKNIWGIEGPIDAAFTRVNCQGKTYIFKGTKYYRFTDGVLDDKYPREISEGFSNIPSDIDAAFAIPANNYHGREKAYFFKGNKYWQYEFQKQPSRSECMKSTPSELFTRYLKVYDDSLEDFFELLFGKKSKRTGPFYISRNWRGIPNNVDAVLPSRIFFPKPATSSLRSKKRKSRRRKNRRRPSNSRLVIDDLFTDALNDGWDDDVYYGFDWVPPKPRCQPTQSVYFFKNDKYYRVNLKTKSVGNVYPPYPRPIGKYWLGCES